MTDRNSLSPSVRLDADATAAYGPLVLRVALGAIFLAHAYAKVALFTMPGTAAFFEMHGFPGWTAYPVVLAELLGGLALIAGFKTRWAALGLIPVMLGALKPHLANGWDFTAPGGGWEFPALVLAGVIAQALIGSGAYSLDAALARVRPQVSVAAARRS
jgi:putative oxidoreductase